MTSAASRPPAATAIERLAELACGVAARDLPPDVLHETRRRLLDALGCMLGGAGGRSVESVVDAVGRSAGVATLVGDRRRSSAPEAALANTSALRFLDYMDGHPGPYSCHPSLVIPAVLAVAEQVGASGLEVARAIALGYEVDIRLQLGSGDPDISTHGWSGSTNLGIAIPVALSGLLGLTEDQLVNALAISTVHAPALDASAQGQMSDSKTIVDGMVAMSAVTATLLARRGVTGPVGAYDGEGGFVAAVARDFDEEILLGPIDRFHVLDAYTKYFNSVKCGQTAAAAVIECRDEVGPIEEIRSVTVRLAERDWRNQLKNDAERRRPGTRDTANHSAVYCVAAALVDGDLRSAQFAPDRVRDPRILAAIDKTTLEASAELTAYWPAANPAQVEIVTGDGRTVAATVLYSPGHPQNPMTDEQLAAKFRSLAGGTLSDAAAERVIATVGRLEDLRDITPLMRLLTKEEQ